MLGAIIGDIVGSRFEFNNHRSTEFQLFHQDCSFTDDTICTVAVADWLTRAKDPRDLDTIMRMWCNKYRGPKGGYGGMFGQWVSGNIKQAYNSFGNGSAMRVSPCGWLPGLDNVMEYARRSATITHNHPEGIKGAQCIADLIWRLRNGQKKAYIVSHVAKGYDYDISRSCDYERRVNTFNETCQVTVPQAIRCFLESTDFESAIRLAVSIGGDSDTIAAITGSLAEAAYGIPDWIEEKAMEYLPDDMKEVINNFKNRLNGKK